MTAPAHRKETRKERYIANIGKAKSMPVSVATCHFEVESNVGFLARACACFGVSDLHIMGKIPSYDSLRRSSGGMSNFINIHKHRNPVELIEYCINNEYLLMSAELTEESVSLHDLVIPMDTKIMLVLGSERLGVPAEILHRSDIIVQVPMCGIGACLNTSQTGNIILYELAKRLLK